jgi:hypothetical protein
MKPAAPPAAPPDDAAADAMGQTGRRASKATTARTGTPRRLLTDIEAAEYCGVSRSYLRAQVAARRIPRVELPSVDGAQRARVWRVDVRDLDRWIDASKT